MNKVQTHLISCLAEECCEVAQEVSKAIRFGLNDRFRPDGTNPQMRLINELNDVLGVAMLLVQEGVLPADWASSHLQHAKRDKVLMYMEKYGVLKD